VDRNLVKTFWEGIRRQESLTLAFLNRGDPALA
jgi:hypothetical protein